MSSFVGELFDVMRKSFSNTLSEWRSSYKIHEDLPYIAENLMKCLLDDLREKDYMIQKIRRRSPGFD